MSGQVNIASTLCKQVELQLVQADTAIDVKLVGDCVLQECLLLKVKQAFTANQSARLNVRFFGQSFTVDGIIERCRERPEGGFILTYKLNNADNLQTRMLLQLSRMEQYRNKMANEGRLLSLDEAACEWIAQYAEEFAKEFDNNEIKGE